jgi:predicted MPP superfamily phosphohydrolase
MKKMSLAIAMVFLGCFAEQAQDNVLVSVRKFEYDMDASPNTKVEIIQISDLHFNYIRPDELSNPTLAATNTGRTWLKISDSNNANQGSIPSTINAMQYASKFDQTVITGDAIDVLSEGALDLVHKYVWDVDTNVIIAPGNHEYYQSWETSPYVSESLTYEQREQILANRWKHDLHYYSRLIKDKVLCVMLDNADGSYLSGQADKLAADIQRARESGYIILIFQHQPISTGNPLHTEVAPIPGSPYSSQSPHNFYAAPSGSEAYNIIVSSADVIKGIFTGHLHADFSIEIAATANGQPATIPQHVLTANPYNRHGNVMKITVNYSTEEK